MRFHDLHVHLHRGRTQDAETAHDPKTGQFTSGQHHEASVAHKASSEEHTRVANTFKGNTSAHYMHHVAAEEHKQASLKHRVAGATLASGTKAQKNRTVKEAHAASEKAQAQSERARASEGR